MTECSSKLFDYTDLPETPLKEKTLNKNSPLDQWYTKNHTAKYCLEKFQKIANENNYDLEKYTFIEPSAGNGSFGNLLPKDRRILLDIDPKDKSITKCDFLSWAPSKLDSYAVIGNPPFGNRGSLALTFINRSSEFADILGFILPMNFSTNSKSSAKSRVRGFYCLHQEDLPEDSFYLPNGNNPKVFTIFQIWGKRKPKIKKIKRTCDSYVGIVNITKTDKSFSGIRWMDQCNFFISTTFYEGKNQAKVVTDFSKVSYGSGLGIVIKRDTKDVSKSLENINWVHYSSKATNGCRHICKENVLDALISNGFIDE